MRKFPAIIPFFLLALAGCGDDAPPSAAAPAGGGGLDIRVVDAVGEAAGCGEGEMLLSAYCFADPDRSISASGPAMRAGADGTITVSCLTGGRNLRLFCIPR